MNPRDPVGPAFDSAADKSAGWRKQQEAALNDAQRNEYSRMQRDHSKTLREHSERFHEQRWELIDEEKRRLMLMKPAPALRMLPTKGLKEARAYNMAKAAVDERHEIERATIDRRQQDERDGFLHNAALARQSPSAAPDHALEAALRARVAQRARSLDRDNQRGDEGRQR